MTTIQFNLSSKNIDHAYANGLLPQRNDPDKFYSDSSCRSNLSKFKLSSENRRIIRLTQNYHFQTQSSTKFVYNYDVQKNCHLWAKSQNWKFPTSSIKTIFKHHIFNFFYTWFDEKNQVCAYSVCYQAPRISHIAYVFYHPQHQHNLPVRQVLQSVVDSHSIGLQYCYLGRFNPPNGYYKRNLPGFENFVNGQWQEYNSKS